MNKLLQNSKMQLKTRVKFLNSFICSKLTYSCQKWNIIVGHFEKLDVTYRNPLRKMDSSVLEVKMKSFDASSIIKKFMRYDAHPILANFIRKWQKNYAGHVVRMHIERCQKQRKLILPLLIVFFNNSLKR